MPHMSGDDKAAFVRVVRWLHRFQRTFEVEDEGWERVEGCLEDLERVLTRFEAGVRRGAVVRRIDLGDVRRQRSDGAVLMERGRRRRRRTHVDWDGEPMWVPTEWMRLYRR